MAEPSIPLRHVVALVDDLVESEDIGSAEASVIYRGLTLYAITMLEQPPGRRAIADGVVAPTNGKDAARG